MSKLIAVRIPEYLDRDIRQEAQRREVSITQVVTERLNGQAIRRPAQIPDLTSSDPWGDGTVIETELPCDHPVLRSGDGGVVCADCGAKLR